MKKGANNLCFLLHLGILWKLKSWKVKEVSNCLTSLPIAEHSFTLHKGALKMLPACDMNESLLFFIQIGSTTNNLQSIMHWVSLFWEKVFPFIRHNDIRDTKPQLNNDVYHNVLIKSRLQTLSSEFLALKDCRQVDVQLDIRAQRFLGNKRQLVCFEIRIFISLPQTYQNQKKWTGQ